MRTYLALICVAVVMAVSGTAMGAMLHATPNYAAQQTSITPGIAVPFDVYVYADDLPGGGLLAAEFALTYPPGLFLISTTVLHSGINVGTPPEFIVGYPSTVLEPADLVHLLFMDFTGAPDQLIEIGAVSVPTLPGTPAVVDPSLNIHPVDYCSGLLVNPTNQTPPAWTPEPATVAILGLGSLVLVGRRR